MRCRYSDVDCKDCKHVKHKGSLIDYKNTDCEIVIALDICEDSVYGLID